MEFKIKKKMKDQKFKKGDKVVWNGSVILSGNSHITSKNQVFTISTNGSYGNGCGSYGGYFPISLNGRSCGSVYGQEIKLYAQTKQQLEEDIAELEKEKKVIQRKLEIMNKFDMSSYDENTVKVYETLELIDKKGISKIDKAKAIAKLINDEG